MSTGILISVVIGQMAILFDPGIMEQLAKLTGVALLRQEAADLEPLVESRLARSVLKATADLPTIAPRMLYVDEVRRTYLTEAETKALDVAARGKHAKFPVDESFYYTTRYCSPLAYARSLDLPGRGGGC